MKLSLIIEAINRGATRTVDGVGKSMRGLGRASRETSADLKKVDREMNATERSSRRLARAAYGVGYAFGASARMGIKALAALDRKTALSAERQRKLAGWAGGKLGRAAGVAAGGVMAAGIAGFYSVVSAGLEFEKYGVQLTGLMGSVAEGKKAMAWVTDFARDTPYELGEVMEAFIRLKSYGIDPTDGSLRTLGDTAGGMGKPLMAAVEMIADAQSFEFERLKEFGITAKQKGEQVTFSFVKNNKQMVRVAKKTAVDVRKTLDDIFSDRFAGGMKRQAATTEGKWSNVMDRLKIQSNRVWEGGFGSSVNRQLDRFSAWVDKLEADGSLKKWADETGKSMGDFVGKMGDADWVGMGKDVATLAGAIRDLAKGVAWLTSYDSGPANFLNGIGKWLHDAGERNSPFGPDGNATKIGNVFGTVRDGTRRAPRAPLTGGVRVDRSQGLLRAPRPVSPYSTPNFAKPAAPGHAQIALKISADRGLSVTPTRVAATGANVELDTGKTMGGFA